VAARSCRRRGPNRCPHRRRPPDTGSHQSPPADDVAALHAFEVSPLFKPPVAAATNTLTPLTAAAWLALAHHWLDRSATSGDLRFLNAACKLVGAVWINYRTARHRPVANAAHGTT
jgi:hypothetical protein